MATAADNRLVLLTMPNGHEPDHPQPVTADDLAATLEAETEPVDRADYVDEAPRGDDAFGI